MKEEDISSQNTNINNTNNNSSDQLLRVRSYSPPHTPAASSAGASSPAVPVNVGSVEWSGHGHGLSRPSCRPWDRGDLLRRLATFKPVNWFGKPKAASSLACAQRGWVNVDVDKIECECCGASLQFGSPASMILSEADSNGEEFAKQLDGGHQTSCSWKGNSCPECLVQFPPTPPSALIGGYKDRCDGLLQFYSLPVISASAIEQMRISRGPIIDRLLAQTQVYTSGELGYKMENISGIEASREEVFNIYSRAQKLISLCGWEPRWLPNVQDCEEHSAQSARNGCSSGPSRNRGHLQDAGLSRKVLSTSSRKITGNDEVLGPEFKCESRSPLLDCSLCGVTIRIWDFSTVSRPARFALNNVDLPETSKKMGLTRGVSAASGINGWVATDGPEKEQNEDHDEAATTDNRRVPLNAGVALNLTMAVGSSSERLNRMPEQFQVTDMGRDLVMGQPAGSEVGDRAASYESRGPSTRKRSFDEGGSTVDRPHLRMQQADSVEGTVVDRDGDEVNDSKEYSAGPSKRAARDYDVPGIYGHSYRRDSSGAGPSHSLDMGMDRDANRYDPFNQGNAHVMAAPSTRDSTHVSSIIAMDTVCHSENDDSMESVENYPGDVDDVNFTSMATFQSPDLNDPSELNCSNQAQQSTCFQPVAVGAAGETGVSSTNDEEVLNAETVTAHGRDGLSFGISGGSVGMGASHEAEIHGTDISVHRGDSVIGDIEPVAEVIENQGQTGESAPDNGQTDDFVPEGIDREDPHGDSQDVVFQSVGRADSGSKIVGSPKAESVESGEKTSNVRALVLENSVHPSLSCNAVVCSGYEASKEEVTQTGKASATIDCAFLESGYMVANGIGPPNGESINDEAMEFDPIKHHNCFCPWVNGNVAAAGCSNIGSSSSGAVALCGWQLTLDALDTFQSIGNVQIQTMESESAASLCKDDHRTPCRKLLARHSFVKNCGQN